MIPKRPKLEIGEVEVLHVGEGMEGGDLLKQPLQGTLLKCSGCQFSILQNLMKGLM